MTPDAVTNRAHPSCKCYVEVEGPLCIDSRASVIDQRNDSCPCGPAECVGTEEAVEEQKLDLAAA